MTAIVDNLVYQIADTLAMKITAKDGNLYGDKMQKVILSGQTHISMTQKIVSSFVTDQPEWERAAVLVHILNTDVVLLVMSKPDNTALHILNAKDLGNPAGLLEASKVTKFSDILSLVKASTVVKFSRKSSFHPFKIESETS